MEKEENTEPVVEEESETVAAPPTSAPSTRASKKRTKTGCITCRKRRIKCGEERPFCKNCIKSKRDCGGYIQPVVFKQPNGDVRIPGNDAGGVYHGTFGGATPIGYGQHPYGQTETYLQSQHSLDYPQYSGRAPPAPYGIQGAPQGPDSAGDAPSVWSLSPDTLTYNQQRGQVWNAYPHPSQISSDGLHRSYNASYAAREEPQPRSYSFSQVEEGYSQIPLDPSTFGNHAYGRNPPSTQLQAPAPEMAWTGLRSQESQDLDPRNSFVKPSLVRGQTLPNIEAQTGSFRQETTIEARRYSAHGFVQRPSFGTSIPTSMDEPPTFSISISQSQEVEEEDEDLSDVEMEHARELTYSSSQTQHELSSMLVKYSAQDKERTRTFTTFLTPNVLATYRPSHSVSPLQDEKVARIFCHFISVMGPCISVYERQASNSPITFSNVAVPASQKMLWSYTMPSMALQHPALLHAILALSALHIAKLQNTSEDPSLKHFSYAVRRVGKLLGLPRRRHEIATLATILVLGFYEVMSADHSRWSLHLAGAKDLVMEFDFAGMTRTTRRMRDRAKANFARKYASSYEEMLQIAGVPETLLSDVDWEVDEELISRLTGLHVQYSNQWQPNISQQQTFRDFTGKEIEDYKIKSDLRWWYCKQDIFQGMVSGDPLLMPFEHWVFCPPRGQIGKLEAAYASMDHLCLIMARLIDFGGKDRKRKQKVVASQGGQWRPPPGFLTPFQPPGTTSNHKGSGSMPAQTSSVLDGDKPAANSARPRVSLPNTRGPPSMPLSSMPSFHGMMPLPTEPIEMNSTFRAMEASIRDPAFSRPLLPAESRQTESLEAETQAALARHADIASAFELFARSLGPDFESLSADSTPPISTPFGPALQYKTYTIACIWAFYYVGKILLRRLHPHMPPAAMVAAGIAAQQTKDFAQIVGKICAGLYFPQQYSMQNGVLNPSLGAAMIESTFCLLFAGVQYQEAAQRGWTISKLNDISKMTGWQTSASVAAACEVAWQKTGEAGRGEPYVPTMDRDHKDIRIRAIFNRKPDFPTSMSVRLSAKEKGDEPAFLSHDRDLIDSNPASRVHWALGLLSVEDDIAKLSINTR